MLFAALVQLAALSASNGAVPACVSELLPFEQLADGFLREHGLDAAALGTAAELVEAVSDRVPLGFVEVLFPAESLEDRAALEDLRELCAALIDGQRQWLLLHAPDEDARPEAITTALADFELLAGALGRLSAGNIPTEREGTSRDLVQLLNPEGPVSEAAARLDAYALGGGPLAPGRTAPLRVRIALVPTRAQFVPLICAAGRADAYAREAFWVEGLETYVEADLNGLAVIALEYFDGARAAEYERGVSMKARGSSRQAQQIVQLALLHLFEAAYDARTDVAFDCALASELVVDVFGEVETRTDGDTGARSSEGRSMFVPGGNPNGGLLPPNAADGRWREDHGADRFVRALRAAQKAGAKEIGERGAKHTGFQLRSEDGRDELVVRGPFLGPDARAPIVPAGVRGDWLDFQRAYRIAFVHWLREHGAGKQAGKHGSEARFAELLVALGCAQGEDLLALAPRLYDERSLSDAALSEGSLEGDFLRWLAKQ